MPLLGRKPFERIKPPEDLHPDEKLFYCRITNEVFREYEEFFDRVILCNSLVWTCSLTGRPGLTYQEATESEKNARITLDKFPKCLRRPVLFLATLTSRGRLNDMCDDVFMFMKNRYFVGEKVEVAVNGIKKNCEVIKVISPEKDSKSPSGKQEGKQKPVKNVSPDKLKYEVKPKDGGKPVVVKSQCLSRSKGSYTRANNKLFLKRHTTNENGVFKVKDSVVQKFKLKDFQFNDAFSGPLPKYAASPAKKKAVNNQTAEKPKERKKSTTAESSGKKTIQGKLDFKKESPVDKASRQLMSKEKEQEEFEKQRSLLEQEKQKRREELKKRLEEEKEKLKEQKLKERERIREEKRKLAEYMSSWKKPRDDLECDDLKDLPKTTPIECSIPVDCFGDAVMVMEFLNTFGDMINLKDSFPHGFTFEHLEKALTETNIQGCLNDVIQLLLTSIFQLQDTEAEKCCESIGDSSQEDLKANKNMTSREAVLVANAANQWPQRYHGTSLQNMNLDSFCLTEILRLHILASGCEKDHSFAQGLNGISEDPGLLFKVEEAELVQKLASATIFETTCEERLKILSLLVNQLSSFESFRNTFEDRIIKVRPLKQELRHLRCAYSRQVKGESTNNKMKKKLDEKGNKSMDQDKSEVENKDQPNSGEEETEENLTPEQKQELEEKRKREEARRRADFQRRERELRSQIEQLQASFQIIPLGRDRAFRRFWVFRSLPGLFVEDDDKFVGQCLPKETPQALPSSVVNRADGTVNIKKYLQHMNETKNGSSDKENDILQDLAIIQSDLTMPLKNRKLSDLNARVDVKNAASDREVSNCYQCREKSGELPGNGPRFCPHSKGSNVFGKCTASIFTCPVHNLNAPRTKWSFYYKEEDLEMLLAALNARGFRESALKNTLILKKDSLREVLSKCQYSLLNKTLPPPEVRKSQRHMNFHKSPFEKMEPDEAMELTFRDMIVEFENRIYAGGLGSIKVQDRLLWIEAIQQRSYDKQCDEEAWASRFPMAVTVKEEDCDKVERVVRDLAFALLQVSDGIEGKFLNPPLGESESFKQLKEKVLKNIAAWEARQKVKEEEENDKEASPSSSCPTIPKAPLLRWQESLVQCTSMSQLFVHLNTLERSVAWDRSVLRAHCRICRRRGDGENMLLCDGCNRGHHLYCLKPPLLEIPQGDWFCTSCKPPEKTLTPQKRGRVQTASDSENEESDEDEEESFGDSEEMSEEEEEEEEEPADNSDVEYPAEMLIEACEICGGPGIVVCCDKCPKVYHPECINMKRVPRGEWMCPKCQKKEEAVKKSQRHGLNGNYGTRAHTLVNDTRRSSRRQDSCPKIQIKAAKRKYEDSYDSDFIPYKKTRTDSVSSSARRQSKTAEAENGDVLDYITCVDALDELLHHPSSWPFLAPVSKKDAPDYHLIIKRPMDFGTIRSKLNNFKYKNNEDFVLDVFLVFQNCEVFNPKHSPEFKAGRILCKEANRLLVKHNLISTSFLKKHPIPHFD